MGNKCSGSNSNDYDDHVPTSREINLAIVASEEYQIKPRLIEDLIKKDSDLDKPPIKLVNDTQRNDEIEHSQQIDTLQLNRLIISQNSPQIYTKGILKNSSERRSRSNNSVHFNIQQKQLDVQKSRSQQKAIDQKQKSSVLKINLLYQESEHKQINIQNI